MLQVKTKTTGWKTKTAISKAVQKSTHAPYEFRPAISNICLTTAYNFSVIMFLLFNEVIVIQLKRRLSQFKKYMITVHSLSPVGF